MVGVDEKVSCDTSLRRTPAQGVDSEQEKADLVCDTTLLNVKQRRTASEGRKERGCRGGGQCGLKRC